MTKKRLLLLVPAGCLVLISVGVFCYQKQINIFDNEKRSNAFHNVNKAYAICDTLAGKDAIKESEPAEEIIYGTVQGEKSVEICNAPSKDAEVIGNLFEGDEVIVIGTSFADQEWYQISYGTLEGFAKSQYFTIRKEAIDE